MKTKKLEKWLLLEQSGELSPRQLRQLGHELEVSEKARKLRADLGILSSSVKKTDVEPSPWTVARIAARLRDERRPVSRFSNAWKPALALAASLTVVTGILNFQSNQTASAPAGIVAAAGVDVWNDPFEEDLSRLENLIAAASGDPLSGMEL